MRVIARRAAVLMTFLGIVALTTTSCSLEVGADNPASANLSSDEVAAALQAIQPQAIEAHIRFLADDLLEGRAPGNRGFEIASRYVETHFR